MEHNRMEIILLASGILVLVALLSVILWLGNRKRNQEQRRDSAESQQRRAATTTHTKGRDCLFREVFPDHGDHDSPLTRLGEYYNDADGGGGLGPLRSFAGATRRRRSMFAGEQHELKDIRHELGNERGRRGDSFGLVDVEDDAEAGVSGEESKSDAETSAGGSGDAGTRTRRRTSSAVRLHGLRPPRKSQDHPLTDREKG